MDSAPFYILKCDVYLPKKLEFIPVPFKLNGNCYYKSGMLRNQYYNSVDIAEIIRFGGKVVNIYSGIAFSNSIKNPFRDFITLFFELRKEYKKQGNDILDSMCKLILNSCYGKTVQKDIDSVERIVSQKQFEKLFDNSVKEHKSL